MYTCNKCFDTGWQYAVDESGKSIYSEVVPCECRKEEHEKEKKKRLLNMCELPSGTEKCTFDNFEPRPELDYALKYAKQIATGNGNIKWLTMKSDTDTGKTHLAIAVCREWIKRGEPARYVYVPLLLNELRSGFRSQEHRQGYDYRFQVYLTVPLLVLDDLGVERNSEFAREQLDTIVDYRAVNGLPLIITTNLAPDEMSPRIASRIQRVTFGRVVEIEAEEYRTYKQRRYSERSIG